MAMLGTETEDDMPMTKSKKQPGKAKKPPVLPDFTTAAFGDNWREEGSWRSPKPGERIVSKKELAAVVKAWRAACAAYFND